MHGLDQNVLVTTWSSIDRFFHQQFKLIVSINLLKMILKDPTTPHYLVKCKCKISVSGVLSTLDKLEPLCNSIIIIIIIILLAHKQTVQHKQILENDSMSRNFNKKICRLLFLRVLSKT